MVATYMLITSVLLFHTLTETILKNVRVVCVYSKVYAKMHVKHMMSFVQKYRRNGGNHMVDKSAYTCDGCLVFSEYIKPCPYARMDSADECPCRICLVKIMCEDSCNEYEVFIKKQKEISYAVQQSSETRL